MVHGKLAVQMLELKKAGTGDTAIDWSLLL